MIKALVTVKGIGRWSAEMFLIFRLHRPDVLPVGDLIVTAVQRVYRLRKKPTPGGSKIGEAWRPYRSVASWCTVAEPRQRAGGDVDSPKDNEAGLIRPSLARAGPPHL